MRRLDAEAAYMVGCYYNAHRPQDGQWLPADSMPKTATGQPVAFVALGAHGLYTGVSWACSSCGYLACFATLSGQTPCCCAYSFGFCSHCLAPQITRTAFPDCSGSDSDRSVCHNLACISLHGVQQRCFASTSAVLTRFWEGKRSEHDSSA